MLVNLVILAGDFNTDPTVIPSLAKGISDGQWIDLERAFAVGRGVPPLPLLVSSNLTKIKGSRRDFLLACPIALRLQLRVLFCRPLVYSSFCCLGGVCSLCLGCYC